MIQVWTYNVSGIATIVSDAEALTDFGIVRVPGRGAKTETFFDFWKINRIGGFKLDDWAVVNRNHPDDIRRAIWMFGGVFVVISDSDEMDRYEASGKRWEFPIDRKTGAFPHACPAFSFTANELGLIPMGNPVVKQRATWDFACSVFYSTHALLCVDAWLGAGVSPSGYTEAELRNEIDRLKKLAAL